MRDGVWVWHLRQQWKEGKEEKEVAAALEVQVRLVIVGIYVWEMWEVAKDHEMEKEVFHLEENSILHMVEVESRDDPLRRVPRVSFVASAWLQALVSAVLYHHLQQWR